MKNTLNDKTALVTGASRGIGRAIALALARAGANVAVNFKEREAEALEVCSQVSDLGRGCLAVRADVSIASEVTRLLDTVEANLGIVQVLINNAGITRPQDLEQITETDWDEILAVNLKSAFLMSQAVVPKMRKRQWGRIVNLSSVAAQLGGVVGPHYAASKAGILGLTHSYAKLLAKDGITVNAIAPALIATEMVSTNPNATPTIIPMNRFGSVEEVAEVAVMLACNGYITGQTINVNGGWYMA
jgi:3-oxoacyl-[acyl-carrier protein] reductase